MSMRTLLLLLIACAGLSAQISLTPTFEITREDAQTLIWDLQNGFLDEADTDANGTVSPAEARAWTYGRLGMTLDRIFKQAYQRRKEADRAGLPADHKAAIDAYEAAKAALEAFERRK